MIFKASVIREIGAFDFRTPWNTDFGSVFLFLYCGSAIDEDHRQDINLHFSRSCNPYRSAHSIPGCYQTTVSSDHLSVWSFYRHQSRLPCTTLQHALSFVVWDWWTSNAWQLLPGHPKLSAYHHIWSHHVRFLADTAHQLFHKQWWSLAHHTVWRHKVLLDRQPTVTLHPFAHRRRGQSTNQVTTRRYSMSSSSMAIVQHQRLHQRHRAVYIHPVTALWLLKPPPMPSTHDFSVDDFSTITSGQTSIACMLPLRVLRLLLSNLAWYQC